MKKLILILIISLSLQSASAIRGGLLVDSESLFSFWKHTLKVIFPGDLICTGVITGPNTFYTAKHCFDGENRFTVELLDMSETDKVRTVSFTFSLNRSSVKSPLSEFSPSNFLSHYEHSLENVSFNSPDDYESSVEIFSNENSVEIQPGNSGDDLFEVDFSTGELAVVTLPEGMEFESPFEAVEEFPLDSFLSENSFQDFTGLDIYISGFGDTSANKGQNSFKPSKSKEKLQAQQTKSASLPLRYSKQVLEGYGFFNPEVELSRLDNLGIFYTGGSDTLGSACFGDSGGPMYVVLEDKLYLAGIQVFELINCRFSGYIPLPTYRNWIEDTFSAEETE